MNKLTQGTACTPSIFFNFKDAGLDCAPNSKLEDKANQMAQDAFEAITLDGFVVCDKLRDIQWTIERQGGQNPEGSALRAYVVGEGVFFAYDESNPQAESQKMSFHVRAKVLEGAFFFEEAYAYEIRKGCEVGCMFTLAGYPSSKTAS